MSLDHSVQAGVEPTAVALARAKEVLSGCLFVPVERIDDDADIHSLKDMDSLTFEAIVLEIEARTGAEVDPLALVELRSVKDLARLLA